MLRSILDLATRILDVFVARAGLLEEWTRARLRSLQTEVGRSDSADARSDYSDIEGRARKGQHDGNRSADPR